jgi:hypothetical protein
MALVVEEDGAVGLIEGQRDFRIAPVGTVADAIARALRVGEELKYTLSLKLGSGPRGWV